MADRKLKIYIAGKITGMEVQAAKNFENFERLLTDCGFEAVNPMKLNHDHDKEWASYMRVCIAELMKCDAVCKMANCSESKGAAVELFLASALDMPVFGLGELPELVFGKGTRMKDEGQRM